MFDFSSNPDFTTIWMNLEKIYFVGFVCISHTDYFLITIVIYLLLFWFYLLPLSVTCIYDIQKMFTNHKFVYLKFKGNLDCPTL